MPSSIVLRLVLSMLLLGFAFGLSAFHSPAHTEAQTEAQIVLEMPTVPAPTFTPPETAATTPRLCSPSLP